MYAYVYESKVFVDTVLWGPFKLSTYRNWLVVRDLLEADFVKRGILEYFALVDTKEKVRWVRFLGFEHSGFNINGTIDIMVRNGY